MDVTPLIRQGQQVIQSYAWGGFRISGQAYNSAVIVTPDGVQPWNAGSMTGLTEADFAPLLGLIQTNDVFLLGTGKIMQFLPPDLRKLLKSQGLSIDVMATGAACRTYNVLMAEGRRVVAAMLPDL